MKFRKRLVIGDIHGMYKKLLDVLKLSEFDNELDLLIVIGDICDRGDSSWEVAEYLLTIKNLIFIRGNHDDWFLNWANKSPYFDRFNWARLGGDTTMKSYDKHKMDNINKHRELYASSILYYIIGDKCFVHGGFGPEINIAAQANVGTCCWDRTLVEMQFKPITKLYKEGDKMALSDVPVRFKDGFKEVYIGHTPTTYFGYREPVMSAGIINVDTGCGKGGKLTILDIDSKEYWQC